MRMGKIYAKAIVANERTLDSVGKLWRPATIAALEAMAADGTISEERLAEILGEGE